MQIRPTGALVNRTIRAIDGDVLAPEPSAADRDAFATISHAINLLHALGDPRTSPARSADLARRAKAVALRAALAVRTIRASLR